MLQRNNQGPSLPAALAGITISLTVSPFVHLPSVSFSPSLWSLLHLEKERQTHFHTNGVKACSPGTQWNYKYFIFAWKPCAITPWPLSLLFHSFSSFNFYLFVSLIPTNLCYPLMTPSVPSFKLFSLSSIQWIKKKLCYIHHNLCSQN